MNTAKILIEDTTRILIANDTNNEHDKDTNGRYNKDAKEDSENIADDMHHNNREQGHLELK